MQLGLGMDHKRQGTSRHHRARRWWVVLGAAGLLSVWLVLGLRFITFAQGDEPRTADAVYVLGPATPERFAEGVALIEAGYSNDLVVTVSENPDMQEFCEQEQPYDLYCVFPEPVTTGGEAQKLAQLAEQHQWESVMVVTMRSHMTRAEILFNRCFTGDISMIDEGRPVTFVSGVYQFFYETAAFVKNVFTPTC